MQSGYISGLVLHKLVHRIGNDLADSSGTVDSFDDNLNENPVRYSLMTDILKNMRDVDDNDYDEILNANPTLQEKKPFEYNFAWNPFDDSASNSRARFKNEAPLPAYCNPPNPCPVGYTEDQQCETDFENTSAFSRDYQEAQECMCDDEHMFNCPSKESKLIGNDIATLLAKEFQLSKSKDSFAKKSHSNEVCSVTIFFSDYSKILILNIETHFENMFRTRSCSINTHTYTIVMLPVNFSLLLEFQLLLLLPWTEL